MMHLSPAWHDDVARPSDLASMDVPESADVAVVGGGYTGLSAARTLARRGVDVIVLESGRLGRGASSRNGGQVCPGLKRSASALFDEYGPELGAALWRSSVESVRFLEDLLEEEGIECDYEPTGSLTLAVRPSHYEKFLHATEWLETHLSYTRTPVPPERLADEIGSPVYHGGWLESRGGGLHPTKYLYGLARSAARAGARIFEKAHVCRVERSGAGFRLDTTRGPVKAEEVLIATNGHTQEPISRLARRVFPVGSYIVTTEPLEPELRQELSPRGRMFFDSRWLLNYFRLTPDGRLAMGGRNNLSPDLSLEQSARVLRDTLIRVFPQLAGTKITHSWTGRLGCTFDLLPHAGTMEGVHYVLGFNGHGVALGTLLGHRAGLRIAGEDGDDPFARIAPPTRWFYWKKPWFLPLAAVYYRFLDRVS